MKKNKNPLALPKRPDITPANNEIIVQAFQRGRIQVALLGLTPFVCNRQSEKTKQELLLPKGKKTQLEKELSVKHEPLKEFRDSPYLSDNEQDPTLIMMKGGAFKSAACDSATDTPGVYKAAVSRLISVPELYVHIYGTPKIWMTDVRNSGINRTPDIRTRAIIPEWCAIVTFSYVKPHITEQMLFNLIANGGMTRGVGDGRTEKGALDFGQFTIMNLNDPIIKAIMKAGGRSIQQAAMDNPEPYDKETADLLTWFEEECARRRKAGKASRNGNHEVGIAAPENDENEE